MNVFTVDIDWAPESVIADTLELFEKFGVACTVFATHRSAVLASCDPARVEVGIHPNFNPLLAGGGGSAAAVIDELLAIYPDARGVRSHSMTQSTPLLDLFHAKGLRYDVNHFLPYWSGLRPFRAWNGLLRIPYNWEDDVHFSYGRSFDETGLDSDAALNVLDFHPIHVFLNSDTPACYAQARPFYQDPDRLLACRNERGPGARTLLTRLLSEQQDSVTLSALADQVTA